MEKRFLRDRLFRFGAVIVTVALLFAIAGMARLTAARNSATISIRINNNSTKDIRHLYLAVGNPNNWGPDQLNSSTISPGESYLLTDVSCGGASVRVIAEDANGCFLYDNVSCDADQTWNITDQTTPDCGG